MELISPSKWSAIGLAGLAFSTDQPTLAADFAMADQALENSSSTRKKAPTEHDAAKVGNSAQRSACAARRRARSSWSEGLSQRRFENSQKPAALR